MNGVLEMEGFKDTFRQLYNGSANSKMVESDIFNASAPGSGSGGEVCSSGNGASSDFLIVSCGRVVMGVVRKAPVFPRVERANKLWVW